MSVSYVVPHRYPGADDVVGAGKRLTNPHGQDVFLSKRVEHGGTGKIYPGRQVESGERRGPRRKP